MLAARELVSITLVLAAFACTPTGVTDTPDGPPASPQASAVPAPLVAAPPASAGDPTSLEGGPPPVPLRADMPLAPDSVARDVGGYTLSAVLRPTELTGPPRAPEVHTAGVDAARKKTELRLAIDLTTTRMRVVLLGSGWVLPSEMEIRARSDRFGHVVVWPGGGTYRPLAPGALRALLGERRFDVAPITSAEVTETSELGKRIGIRTRKVEVGTRAANATFEIGKLGELGQGGVLLCRLLLDLMNAPPSTAACSADELPLRAELRWVGHGALGFELTGVLRRLEMPSAPLQVPPAAATFAQDPLPAAGVQSMLAEPALAALRTGPVDVPPDPSGHQMLFVVNATNQLRVLHLDGVPVAWAAPGARDPLPGLVRGRYIAQWRTFLGDAVEPAASVTVPGTARVGAVDGGAPGK
jgi:hypothetical protein